MQGTFTGSTTWQEGLQFAKSSPQSSAFRQRNSRTTYSNNVSAVLSIPTPETRPAKQHSGSRKRSGLGKTSVPPSKSDGASLKAVVDVPVVLELRTADNVRLVVSASGELALWDAVEERLVAQANLHLPISCLHLKPTVVEREIVNGLTMGAIVRWGSAAAPLAELHVSALSDSSKSTTISLTPSLVSLIHHFKHFYIFKQ